MCVYVYKCKFIPLRFSPNPDNHWKIQFLNKPTKIGKEWNQEGWMPKYLHTVKFNQDNSIKLLNSVFAMNKKQLTSQTTIIKLNLCGIHYSYAFSTGVNSQYSNMGKMLWLHNVDLQDGQDDLL